MKNINLLLGIFFIAVLLLISCSSAEYTRSYPAISQSGVFGFSNSVVTEKCGDVGQDFIVQITPFGCTPAVVRDDLLEENDVPVFCQLGATKINPLVNVEAIDSIQLSGKNIDSYVRGVDFQARRAALGLGQKAKTNNPLLNNLGYAVIVLKQQKNSSATPSFVEGNITATLTYNLKDAWGVGKANFYLPELTDSEWEQNYLQYSFWKGRGYIRAEGIDAESQSARIVVYNDQGIISGVNLKKGETSKSIYLPGFNCAAGLQIKLNDLKDPDTRALLEVNGERVEVSNGETFLDGKCKLNEEPKIQGIIQRASIRCDTDDKKNRDFNPILSPKVELRVCTPGIEDGCTEKEYEIGEWLYDTKDSDGKDDKSVYLSFVGKEKENNKDVLYAYFIAIPIQDKVPKLDSGQVEYAASYDEGLRAQASTGNKFFDAVSNAFRTGVSGSMNLGRWIVKGENLKFVSQKNQETFLGSQIEILGLGAGSDSNLDEATKEYYVKAVADYDKIITGYLDIKYPSDAEYTKAEEVFTEKIKLAFDLQQKDDGVRFCEDFKKKYPGSKSYEGVRGLCDDTYLVASSGITSEEVVINGEIKQITFKGIYQPDFSDYGVKVSVSAKGGGHQEVLQLTKGQQIYVDSFFPEHSDSAGNYIQLVEINGNLQDARFSTSASGLRTLRKGVVETIGNYTFTILDINLKKSAQITVDSEIDHTQTKVDFPFKIGIEKRGIKLSPDETRDKIDELNKTIADWNKKSNSLGNLTKSMKTACLGVSAALIVKNFYANIGGKGIARQNVMRGDGGWYQKCQQLHDKKQFDSVEKCLVNYSSDINKDVDLYYKKLQEQNTVIKQIEENCKKGGLLGEKIINDECFGKAYLDARRDDIAANLKDKYPNGINISGKRVSVDEFVKRLDSSSVSIDELRELELNAELGGTQTVNEMAIRRVQANINDIYVNTNAGYHATTLESDAKQYMSNPKIDVYAGPQTKEGVYRGSTALAGNPFGIAEETPVQLINYQGEDYLIELKSLSSDQYGVANIFNYNSHEKLDKNIPPYTKILELVSSFKEYDASSYQNSYISSMGQNEPVLKYYETDPFKGLPALVPFDQKNGWYASIEQRSSGVLRAYDASARINSFYLCNVGKDGIEQNKGGDDDCRMINMASGMPYDSFYGLTRDEVTNLVNRAVDAIQQASVAREKDPTASRVSIKGFSKSILVGPPAVDLPDIQCQDIMSPADCKLMFNVCDPVICPSSRCNLGGAYPVKDVIQSGIVGSIALCLPNFPEVYIPVCLSGLKAGVDSWISVQKSFKDCLQTSLDTGETVGICDEIYSFYKCDFFFKEALPLIKIGTPKVLGILTGQNVRGGGEYLGVKDALGNAEKSVNYFTQYYGANSYKAFKARSLEEFSGDFCQSYVSGVYPSSGDLIDTLTQPDSPSQFTGTFDEIPYTTSTNPPASHYKVFYHIFAGNDRGAYYKVYLQGGDQGSYYKDTNAMRVVDSGYIAKGEYRTNTSDFLAPSGYKQLCIMVNEQVECGFQKVSTDFVVNYISDQYASQQASQTSIKTAESCVSGTSSLYALANLNPQEAATEALHPELYNYGIIRTCANDNPGKGTDEKWNIVNESRWVDVGYCDDKRMRCWLDTQSVKNVIKNTKTESGTLDEVNANYQNILAQSGVYIIDLDGELANIDSVIPNPTNIKAVALQKVRNLTLLLDRVYLSSQKSEVYKQRGIQYGVLANDAWRSSFVGDENNPIDASIPSSDAKEILSTVINYEIEPGETINFKFGGKVHTIGLEGFTTVLANFNSSLNLAKFNLKQGESITLDDGSNYLKVVAVVVNDATKKVIISLRLASLSEVGMVFTSEGLVKSEDYSSPIFEFQDGRTTTKNLFYKFSKGKWYWSKNQNYWSDNSADAASESQTNRDFIYDLLKQENYGNGLKLLIDRTLKNDEGGWFGGGTNLKTTTDKISLSGNDQTYGIFTYRYAPDYGGVIQLKYDKNWLWRKHGGALVSTENPFAAVSKTLAEIGDSESSVKDDLWVLETLNKYQELYNGASVLFSLNSVDVSTNNELRDYNPQVEVFTATYNNNKIYFEYDSLDGTKPEEWLVSLTGQAPAWSSVYSPPAIPPDFATLVISLQGKDLDQGTLIIQQFNGELDAVQEVNKVREAIRNDKNREITCSDCGYGFWNTCYEEECNAIGSIVGLNCIYVDKWKELTFGGSCYEGEKLPTITDLSKFESVISLAINNKDAQGKSHPIVNKNCSSYAYFLLDASTRNKIDPLLLLSLAQQESSCNETAFSGSSYGLMQINAGVWCGKFGLSSDRNTCIEQLYDPQTNAGVGAKILRYNYQYYVEDSVGKDDYKVQITAKCKVVSYQTKYLSYMGWDRALRMYNGPGCSINANPSFVEEVKSRYRQLSVLA